MNNKVLNLLLKKELKISIINGDFSIFFNIIKEYPILLENIKKEEYIILLKQNNFIFIKNILDLKPELYNFFFKYSEDNNLRKIIVFLNHYKFKKSLKNKILTSNYNKIKQMEDLKNYFF